MRIYTWLDRKLGIDSRYLTYGFFWSNLGMASGLLTSFILSLLFANFFPKESYGIYKYALSVFGIATIATLSGMNISVVRAVAQGKRNAYSSGLREKIRFGLIGAAIVLCASLFFLLEGNGGLARTLFTVAVFLPFMDSFALYDSVLQGEKRIRTSSIYLAISNAVVLAVMGVCLVLSKNVEVVLIAYFSSWTAMRGFFAYRLYREMGSGALEARGKEDDVSSYGKHLSVANAINSLAVYLDQIILFHFAGPVEVATLAVAVGLPENLKNFLQFTQVIYLPKLAQMGRGRARERVHAGTGKMALALLAIIIGYNAVAAPLFRLLFPQYPDALFYSRLFSLSLLYYVIALPITYLRAFGETKAQYVYSVSVSCVQIVLSLALIPFFGILGAVLARIAGRLITIVIVAVIYGNAGKE